MSIVKVESLEKSANLAELKHMTITQQSQDLLKRAFEMSFVRC